MYRNTRIRLKLFLIALIIPSVLNGGQITAAEVYEQWRMEMPGFIEPPMEYMIGWNLNEVPGNATVYYDLNGDKVPEIVFAHPIIGVNNAPDCNGGVRTEEQYHTLLTTCPADYAVDYFITKQYSMFRLLKEKVWSRIFRMVGEDGRHVEGCERDRSESESFTPRTVGGERRQSFIAKCAPTVDDNIRAYRW